MATKKPSRKPQRITAARIADIESNRGAPIKDWELQALAKALGVAAEWLRTGKGDPRRSDGEGVNYA